MPPAGATCASGEGRQGTFARKPGDQACRSGVGVRPSKQGSGEAFRGVLDAGGQRESGLPFDGASFEHHISVTATSARFGVPCGRCSTLRSPRPGVSSSCPEHDGLTSLFGTVVAHTRASDVIKRAAAQRTQFGLAGASSMEPGASREGEVRLARQVFRIRVFRI